MGECRAMPKKKKSNRGKKGRKLSILGGLSECSTKFRESDTKFETRNKSDGGTKEVDDYTLRYMNRQDVQQAIHAVPNDQSINQSWVVCSGAINQAWPKGDLNAAMMP